VLIEASATPLRPYEQNKIAEMVDSGFRAWREFHERTLAARRKFVLKTQACDLGRYESLSSGAWSRGITASFKASGFA
jgi:hypothetical protein